MSIFLYVLKAPETRRQYPRRLNVFLDYLKLEGTLEQQAKEFLFMAKQNPQWAQISHAVYSLSKGKGKERGNIVLDY